MLDTEQFAKNIERWALFNPEKAKSLRNLQCKHIEFHSNAKGDLNLKVVSGGETYYLHSVEDPVAEARQWFASLDLNDIQVIFIFGVGLGYYYEAAKEWLQKNSGHYLVFLENDLEVIHRLLQTERGTEILMDKQVWLAFLDEHTSVLDSLAATFLLKKYVVTSLNLYKNTKEYFLRTLRSKLAFYMNLRLGSSGEYSEYGRGFFYNFFRNLLLLPEAHFGNALFDNFKGMPAIICGAGPSLAKNIHILEKLRDRALIFAGGTAMNALNTVGLLPHFGIGIDPNPAQFTRLIMNQAFEIPFFYRNRMLNEALQIVHGPHLYITGSSGYDISQFFEDKYGIKGKFLSEGFNVVNFSLSIAQAMGCNPIIFVGLDLAYSDSLSYCPGIINHPLHPRKDFFGTKSADDELINKEDINGKPVLTLWKWVAESLWFSNFAKNFKNMEFLNATEGGLGFVGIPNVPLSEVAEKILKKQYDFNSFTHGEIQNAPLPMKVTEKNVVDDIKEMLESLIKCSAHFKVIREDFAEVVRILKADGEMPVNILTEKGIQALSEIEQEPAYIYMLRVFSESYMQIYTRDFKRLQYDESLLSQREINLKKMSLNEGKYNFLLETANVNIKIIENILSDYSDQQIKQMMPFPEGKTEAEKQAVVSGEKYAYENETLTIIDPELSLSYTERFVPKKDNGTYKQNYPEGSLKIEQYFLDGLLHGPSTYYAKDGKILARNWFIKGMQQGKGLSYYSSGSLAAIQRYKDGKCEGKQLYFFPNGLIKSTLNYSKGLLNGEVRLYFATGQLQRELHFKDGKREGFDRIWNAAGMLVIEAEFSMDRPVGTARKWYPNGNIAKEVVYEKDTPNFVVREWDTKGFPNVLTHRVKADYFDMVAQQTQKLTHSLELVLQQVQTVAPFIDQVTKKPNSPPDTIKADLIGLQDQIKNLDQINKKLLYETGLDPANQQESIWKTPSNRKEIEKQIEEMAGLMTEEMNSLQRALVATVGILTKKIEAAKDKEKALEKEKEKPKDTTNEEKSKENQS